MRRDSSHPMDFGDALRAVCEQYRVDVKDLRGKRQVSDARLLAMKLLTEEAGFTQREVAAALGLGNGSGVSRSLNRLHVRLAADSALRRQLLQCRERLKHNH